MRRTAANRDKWRSGVEAIVEKERAGWIQRNAVKSRKRMTEKVTYEYERRKRDEEARKRQRTSRQKLVGKDKEQLTNTSGNT